MRRVAAIALGAALLMPARAGLAQTEATQTGAFTPAQRAEIVAILRQALASDPTILRDAVVALQRAQAGKADVAGIAAVAANHDAIFATPGDPTEGNPAGRVTLVEFFDVRCPYCRRMLPDMRRLLAERHDVRLVLKDLPILGPASTLAARALLAAQAQGGYLAMRDALMADGATVDEPGIQRAAIAAGLDWPRLRAGMDAPAVTARIDANLALASRMGIEGTPVLVIGDRLVPGALGLADLRGLVGVAR